MSDQTTVNESAPKLRPTQLRIPAIVLAVLGLALMGAGISKLLYGMTGPGFGVAFMGAVLFGLSFISLPVPTGDKAPEAKGTFDRLTGIFFEPTAVFQSLRFHPNWVAAFLVIALLNAAYVAAFTQRVTAERIINYTVDKMAETPFIPAEAVEKARDQGLQDAKSTTKKVGNAISSMVGIFCFMCFLAALYLVALLAFGGRINFWQALSVAMFAALPPIVISKVISFVLLYIKSPDDIHPLMGQETLLQDNLGVLLSPKDHPVLFVTATSIGLLSFYKLWLVAKGL
ncbi:MAG TPA: YIP1 family protein, partial [Pyrinomonadaceae bacterium]|nr:YIP1 family protein [Pyrinomonadaceae bacterium]